MKRIPLSPDEAAQREQVRRFLNVLIAAAAAAGILLGAQGVVNGTGRSLAIAIVVLIFAALLAAWPRRILAHGRVEEAVTIMALATTVLIVGTAIISPSGALVAATALLIPITAAVPYLRVRWLRRLMIVAWLGTVATAAASLLPDPLATTTADVGNPAPLQSVIGPRRSYRAWTAWRSCRASPG